MKTIPFNEETFDILGSVVGWNNVHCPYCDYYHSQQFVFSPEEGKYEYIKECKECGKKVKVVAKDEEAKEEIDKMTTKNSFKEKKSFKQKTL